MIPPRLDEGSEREAYPPLPEKSFLGDDASYGYDAEDMRAFVDADRASRAALSTGRLGREDAPMDMALCESQSLVLRIGQVYRFTPVAGCKRCEAMAAQANDAYGAPAAKPQGDKSRD